MTVLVVDDEPDAGQLIQRLLEELGAEVAVAASAAEGFELLRGERPHVLVSNMGMPERTATRSCVACASWPAAMGATRPAEP